MAVCAATGQTSSAGESGIEGVITINPAYTGPIRADAAASMPLANATFAVEKNKDEISYPQYGVEITSIVCFLAGASHLSRGRSRLSFFSNGFERAVFRWSLSDQREKIHFADDRIGGFKFAFAHQCPRVAPHIAD
jgi:hypothetical protein